MTTQTVTPKNFSKIVNREVARFQHNLELRTYSVAGKKFILNFEKNYSSEFGGSDPGLICTTWGFDHETLPVPVNYTQLTEYRMKAQLDMLGILPKEVTYKFYYNILWELNN